jgi:hypothetical protein
MSLFISVETRSNLLGRKAPNDRILIPVSRIQKIESFGEDEGCVITFEASSGHVERVTSSVSAGELVKSGVIDLAKRSK